MEENNYTIEQLARELNELRRKEAGLRYDIAVLSTKLDELRGTAIQQQAREQAATAYSEPVAEPVVPPVTPDPVVEMEYFQLEENEPVASEEVVPAEVVEDTSQYAYNDAPLTPPQYDSHYNNEPAFQQPAQEQKQWSLESYIGGNLFSKIGMVILLIGIAIGIKYAVDRDLIGPLMRIILGYAAGGVLLGLAVYLKKKYLNYSAVLSGGAVSIMYFTTYLGYTSYNIFPQTVAFGIMLVVTVFTIFLALHYNMQVIGLLGMVGAYAIPFLLSDGQNRAVILFTYMGIINIGILIIALKKDWQLLFKTAFVATWIIFFSWLGFNSGQKLLAIVFASLFFFTFFVTFLANNVLVKTRFSIIDKMMITANATVYFLACFSLYHSSDAFINSFALSVFLLGVFHLAVAFAVNKTDYVDKSVNDVLLGIAVICVSIAVPLQFDSTTTTVIWVCEAIALFVLAHRYKLAYFSVYSFLVLVVSGLSLLLAWNNFYFGDNENAMPVFNEGFLTSAIAGTGLLLIMYLFFYEKYNNGPRYDDLSEPKIFSMLLPVAFFSLWYIAIVLEINQYWNSLEAVADLRSDNPAWYYMRAKYSTIMVFSLFYVAILTVIQRLKRTINYLPEFTLGAVLTVLAVLFITGFAWLARLRTLYLVGEAPGTLYFVLRYLTVLFAAVLIYYVYKYSQTQQKGSLSHWVLAVLVQVSILYLFSNEVVSWFHMAGVNRPNRLLLTVIWGVYGILLLAFGIKVKHLRIIAIAVFLLAMSKLLLYDLTGLSTLARTVIFILFGGLMLLASFLYNKFSHYIDKN